MKGTWQRAKAAGMCPGCWKRAPLPDHVHCKQCNAQKNAQAKRYYAKHRDKLAAKAREKYQEKVLKRPPKPTPEEPGSLPPLPSKAWLRARIALLEGKLNEAGIELEQEATNAAHAV